MKIKIKRIIASILTFMMIFMNVPTNVFAEDEFTNISYFDIFDYEDAVSKINDCSWAKIESNDSNKKTIKIKLLKDIIGRIQINCDDGTYIILNADGHTVSGGGKKSSYYQAINLSHSNVTVELVGNGTYITGNTFAFTTRNNNQFIVKSGTIVGNVNNYIQTVLEEGYTYYTINYDTNETYDHSNDYKMVCTSDKIVELLRSSTTTFTVAQHDDNFQFEYAANGGTGTMDDSFFKNSEEFIFPECEFVAPAGKHFGGWQIIVDGVTYNYKAGEKARFNTANKYLQPRTVTAVWEDHTYDQKVPKGMYLKNRATCTSNAKYYTSCICGDYNYFKSVEFEAPNTKIPHTYTKQEKTSEYLRAKATNCQEHDTYWYVCSVCGQSAKDDSNAQDMYYSDTQVGEHQYSDKLSSDDTKHYYECTVKGCTSKKDVQKHIVSDWIIDEEATPEKEGTKHKECTVCKRILETQKISKKESGNIEKKNDENITINNDVDYLSKNILTEQEVEKVKQGENAQIYVDVKDEVNKTDLEKVNASLDTYKLGKVYDISLWLKVGENTRQVTTSKEKLGMSLKVPEELINKDSKVKRTYKVMRVHEGKVTLLDGIFDEKTQMITFETDQFSTYALVYSDTKVETPSTKDDNNDKKNDEVVDKDDKKKDEIVNKDNSTSNNQETVKPTVKEDTATSTVKEETKTTVKAGNKTEAKKVKTGDDAHSIFFMGLIGVSLLGIYCLIMKKFIH